MIGRSSNVGLRKGYLQMSEKSRFTADQIRRLRDSPYVLSVTKTTVTFTAEFKKIFYDQRHNGLSPEKVFSKYGIDPEVLGSTRIRGFAQRVEEQASRDDGFRDLRAQNGCHHATGHSCEEDFDDGMTLPKLTRLVVDLKQQVADIEAKLTEVSSQLDLARHDSETLKKNEFHGRGVPSSQCTA